MSALTLRFQDDALESDFHAECARCGIQVTARAGERLRSRYALTARGEIEIKGRGRMATYLLGERIR